MLRFRYTPVPRNDTVGQSKTSYLSYSLHLCIHETQCADPFDRYRHLVFIVVGLVSFYFTDNRASVSTHYSRNLGRVEPLHFEV
jgi:hypothetical protein